MDYNFEGVDRVHIFMDDRNECMNYGCYSNGNLLRKGFFGRDLRPIELYNFLNAVNDSGASLLVGEKNSEENLEEVLTSESVFFQN